MTDDQLFKDDGKMITKVDILMLKFSRRIATIISDEDEETFNPAFKILLIASPIISFLSIPAVIAQAQTKELGTAIVYFFIVLFIFVVHRDHKCNGRGSNIAYSDKLILNLFFGLLINGLLGNLITVYFFSYLGFFSSTLATYYVGRLGGKPPKKEKAEALKPVLNPV